MKHAPAVYVPTEPEGNGLTLPLLLSLLAHGIVIGILIYTYQQPELETVGSIETTMVTPGELAEMQSQILANRAATQAEAANNNAGSATAKASSTNSNTAPSISELRSTSVFTRSNEPADQSVLMTQNHRQRLLEQSQEYDRNMAELAAQLDESALAELDQVQQQKQNELDEEQETLRSFRTKQNPVPRINRPTKDDNNINIETSSSDKTLSLSDGKSTVSNDTVTSSPTTGSGRSAGASRGASNSEIVRLIKNNYNPPVAAKGSVQQTTLTISVNTNGEVTKVTASGPDEAVNEAARQAVLNTRTLPIDTDDPKYPTFTLRFRGSN
ncbi:TonB C-terminal domain-containing protein [uncultured Psychrobacter sp.]|uniref:TonB C-terminal domain-containing protein n=1 Tax=uncultured Psychrobacter sp. TaxID=259303 RepID=UPI0034574CAA